MVGSGALAVSLLFVDVGQDAHVLVARALVISTGLHVLMLALEYGGTHATRHASAAAHMVTHGRYSRLFWGVGVGAAVLAIVIAAVGWSGDVLVAGALAGVLVQVALIAYESVFVRAGQDVPLS